MNNSHKDTAIVALLNANTSLRSAWVQPPEVTHIPFMRSREHFFVLISAYVSPEVVEREKLANECIAVAQVAIGSGLLSDEKAVEVALYAAEGTKLRRVIRLTVLEAAFAQAMRTSAMDLLGEKPQEGITCQWPAQRPQ